LATLLPQLRHLHSLSLPDCGMNEKQALILLHGIHHGIGIAKDQAQAEDVDGQGQQQQKQKPRHGFQLKALNLSGNPIMNGTELGEQLANLLALNNGAIRLLDLNGTCAYLGRFFENYSKRRNIALKFLIFYNFYFFFSNFLFNFIQNFYLILFNF
jgi:hypothetical protein